MLQSERNKIKRWNYEEYITGYKQWKKEKAEAEQSMETETEKRD